MNLSAVVTRIKLNLGLVNIATPFENVDDVIIKIIRDITVPTFSIYQPFKEHMVFNGNELELLERTASYTRKQEIYYMYLMSVTMMVIHLVLVQHHISWIHLWC